MVVLSTSPIGAHDRVRAAATAFGKSLAKHYTLYVMLLVPIAYIIIFHYFPMWGAQIAFRRFSPAGGFLAGEWVGFANFRRFYNSYMFWNLIGNTLGVSVYMLIAGFPVPILLALAINEVRNRTFRKTVQMVTYAPYFISVVILISIVMQVLSPHTGVVNNVIRAFGGTPINFIGSPRYFRSIFVWSGVWQRSGYAAIIYIASLSAIDPQLYEAATIDGAGKLRRIMSIDIPGILPTITILLILNTGRIMTVGFEKVYLLQNDMNIRASEVISTYVYKVGLVNGDYSFATAVGLFNSLLNLFMITIVNKIAGRISETSLW